MKLRFFLIDVAYKEVDGKALIYMFGRAESGDRVIVIDKNFKPYFYVKLKEFNKSIIEELKIIRIDDKRGICEVESLGEKELLLNGQKIRLVKVFANLPRAVPVLRQHIKKLDFVEDVFEADIPFARRYIIDKKITPMMMAEAECEEKVSDYKAKTYIADSLKPLNHTITDPKILAIDIETYNPFGKKVVPERNPILMLGLCGRNLKKVITWKRFPTKLEYVKFVESEAQLIEEFVKEFESYKPEIISGYFSDGFDLPYIQARAKKYNIKLDLGLDNSPLRVNKRGQFPTAQITGIAHLDIFKFVKKVLGRGMDTESYKLDPVAEELLNEKKDVVELESLANVWDNKVNELEPFCKYNMQDAVLTHKLAMKILPNVIELVKLVGLTMFDINRMGFSQLVEWFLIKKAQEFKQLIPNKPGYQEAAQRMKASYEGAYVYEPNPGLYDNIAVFDFRSLYPTIISAHNIGPDTLNCKCCREKIPGMDYVFCKKKKGFMPAVIDEIITTRIKVKEILKKEKCTMLDARQNSLKLLANSFYGYLGFFNSRWYCLECAESVTAYGRYYIKKAIRDAENYGFKVLYTDTDSLFLWLGDKSKQEALKFAEGFNKQLPGIMELEFEGFYKSGIFVFTKGDSTGAKKKYALISEKDDIKIRGFEVVRRNWCLIAKEVQQKVLEIILKEKDTKKAFKFVREVIDKLREHKIVLEKVVMYTQIQKNLGEYENIGPHVFAAKRMQARGEYAGPGTIVKYVFIKGDKLLRDRARLPDEVTEEDYDSEYYINNQIVPAVESIFRLLGYNKKDILEEKAQSKLDKYF